MWGQWFCFVEVCNLTVAHFDSTDNQWKHQNVDLRRLVPSRTAAAGWRVWTTPRRPNRSGERREKSGQAVGARSPSLHSPCLLAPQTPSPLCNGPGGRFLTLSLNENKKGEAETRDQRQTPGRRLHLHLVDDGELHCRLLGRHRPARHESTRS